ncbi:MAG TPA: hypothetical protein DIC22_08705 [Chitinophagaceae bacterium]|jgi:hypothetical protein|nr:hypothetical protein [Chitinophagaceae bacterium]
MQKGNHLKTRTKPSAGKADENGAGKNITGIRAKKNGSNSLKKVPPKKPTVKRKITEDVLTKSYLETAAQKSMSEAAKETIKIMGYNVIARDGWVVKVFPDKRVERISPIPQVVEKK